MSMELEESRNRFDESMKRAVSRCREIGNQNQNLMWHGMANSLEKIRLKGVKMANSKGQSKSEIEADLKHLNEKAIEKLQVN